MAKRPIKLTRAQVLAFRRRSAGLDTRVSLSATSVGMAAWAGLQDSMPRAAVLSMHARIDGIRPHSWEDPALVQLWGPRFSAYAVAEGDRAVFTLGRMPDDPARRRQFEEVADRIEAFLDGRRMKYSDVGRGLGVSPNSLRYAAPTGRVVMRWDGARQPTIWTVPQPQVEPGDARLELARRYLHIFGPATVDAFSEWAGIKPLRARAAFETLADSITLVNTPVGDGWILGDDEQAFRRAADRSAPSSARLLPSGDTFFLLQGTDRELLVPDPARRAELWTSRVWPGAVVVDGEVVGTWRRAGRIVTFQAWEHVGPAARESVEREAASFPLPEVEGRITVRWDG